MEDHDDQRLGFYHEPVVVHFHRRVPRPSLLGDEVWMDPERISAKLEFFHQCKGINPAGSEAEQEKGFQGLPAVESKKSKVEKDTS